MDSWRAQINSKYVRQTEILRQKLIDRCSTDRYTNRQTEIQRHRGRDDQIDKDTETEIERCKDGLRH